MTLFLNFAKIYYICILASLANTYVLLAANLEDFRNLAKKFVPHDIADQITDTALKSIKTKDDSSQNYEVKYDPRANYKEDLPNYNGEDPKQTRFSIKQQEAIDIDDIVEKVKEKLEKEFHEKYEAKLTALQKLLEKNRNETLNRNKKNYENIDYSQDYTPKELSQLRMGARTVKPNQNRNTNQKQPSNVPNDEDNTSYVDDTKTFSKIKIGQAKDSYEDYVIPEKDDYSSSSIKDNPSNQKNGRHVDTNGMKSKQNLDKKRVGEGTFVGTNDRYAGRGFDSIGIKSKQNLDRNRQRDGTIVGTNDRNRAPGFYFIGITSKTNQERIRQKDDYSAKSIKFNFDSKKGRNYRLVHANSKLMNRELDSVETKTKQNPHRIKFDNIKAETENLFYEDHMSEITTRSFKNTMIPTKRVFRFSSPNYYAKIPTVVEKYDFNEPLPEKDREKEDLKYIPNPPSKINGRFQLANIN